MPFRCRLAMTKNIKKRALGIILLCATILMCAFPLYRHFSQPTYTRGYPFVQMVVGRDFDQRIQRNGSIVGANMLSSDNQTGKKYIYSIPSLQGVWQLDESYSRKSSIILKEADGDYISIYCAKGILRTRPNSIYIARFDMDVVKGDPGTSPTWAEGEEVAFERHGNAYRIYHPVPDSVYVARTVWDAGVLEYGWILADE